MLGELNEVDNMDKELFRCEIKVRFLVVILLSFGMESAIKNITIDFGSLEIAICII